MAKPTNYTYDRADRILTAGSTNYTVNNDGNETARGSDSFSFDQSDRLSSAIVAAATTTYVYDGDGKRVTKTVGSTTTNYAYDIGVKVPLVLDDGARKYVLGAAGLAYSVDKSSAAVQVYHADGLGSVRAITDGTGNVAQTYQTDQFGAPAIAQGSSVQPFGFAGEQRDAESGLLYLRARMYDPSIGRFMQKDPISGRADKPCTENRATYVNNNPVNAIDPAGLFTCSISLGGTVSTPFSAGGSIGIGFDDKGQVGVFYAPQFGGSTNVGVAGSVSIALLNEPDVTRLSGPFVYLGASVSLPFFKLVGVAGEAVWDPSTHENGGFVGVQIDAQVGVGLPIPLEVHGFESITSGVLRLSDFQSGIIRQLLGGASPGLGVALDMCQSAALEGARVLKSMSLR